MFVDSGQAEIIRSNQKDEYYLSYLQRSVADIAQTFLGPRTWIQWHKELNVISDLAYFLLTTVAGYQTLGEEYVNIIQVGPFKKAVPSRIRRLFMSVIYAVAPYAVDRILKKLEQSIPLTDFIPTAKQQLLQLMPVVRHTVTLLHRCHLAWFYLHGIYYHLSKRITGINYIQIKNNQSEGPSFKILGYLFILQISLNLFSGIYKLLSKKQVDIKNSNSAQAGEAEVSVAEEQVALLSAKCPLCLEARRQSTLTPCGHLFCWTCIFEWCSTKPECPLCREHCPLSRIVYLQNYDHYL